MTTQEFWEPFNASRSILQMPEGNLLLIEYETIPERERYTYVVYRNDDMLFVDKFRSLALDYITIIRWAIVPD